MPGAWTTVCQPLPTTTGHLGMKLTAIALLTLTVGLGLGGCSSETEPDSAPSQEEPTTALPTEPSEPTATPATTAPEVVHTKIPRQTREGHFPRPEGDYRKWRSDVASMGRTAVVTRRVLPCDDARIAVRADRRVLAHAETVLEQGAYLVSRQLTLYPDTATADTFASQLSELPLGCRRLMGSPGVGAAQRHGYAPDRFLGTKDRSVIFSETDLLYDENRLVYVDIINQRDNAILFTRVGRLNRPVRGAGVLSDKKKNPEFVREVRAQGDRATAILEELSEG